jgi:hypothetical protein
MTGDNAAIGGENDLDYSYRPSILGASWDFKLTARGIEWTAGRRSGRVNYRDVRRLRLSYRPMSMQTHRFVTEIWAEGTPKLEVVSSSWKSMVEQQPQNAPYVAFVTELHRRVARAGVPVQCTQGRARLAYWPGLAIFVGVALALAATVAHAVKIGTYGAAVVIVGFLALFLWQGGNFFRRNRPGVYRIDALPPDLLPRI